MLKYHSDSSKKNINNSSIFLKMRELELLGEQLSKLLVSDEELGLLHQDLETLFLSEKEAWSEKFIKLYGQIITHDINNRVDSLVEKSLEIAGEKEVEKKAVKGAIEELFLKHSLSQENRSYIDMALKVLDGQSEKDSKKNVDIPSHYPSLLVQWKGEELPDTLYAIATLFYESKKDQAFTLLKKRLSSEQRYYLDQKLEKAKVALNTVTNHRKSSKNNQLIWSQALIAMADDIAFGRKMHRLPSFKEIERVFSDLKKLNCN